MLFSHGPLFDWQEKNGRGGEREDEKKMVENEIETNKWGAGGKNERKEEEKENKPPISPLLAPLHPRFSAPAVQIQLWSLCMRVSINQAQSMNDQNNSQQ